MVGLGKLGSVVAAVYASAGHKVMGVDVNSQFVEAINLGRAPHAEPGLDELIMGSRENLAATTDIREAMKGADASIVIVPTPSTSDGSFSNDFVLQAVKGIGEAITENYHLVVIASTVSPMSCDTTIGPELERNSKRLLGETLGMVYSPEFIALGSVVRDMHYPDLVLVGASDELAASRGTELFKSVVRSEPSFHHMSLVSAEIAKLAVNTFVTTKISYANMIDELCDSIPSASGVDVLAAVGADSRIGGKYLRPALGYGGPCFPRDNRALKASATSVGTFVPLADATDAVNSRQVTRLVAKVDALGLPNSRVAVLGLSYKPETPVCEESQGILIANRLSEVGYDVVAHDPQAMDVARPLLRSAITLEHDLREAIDRSSVIVVATPWEQYRAAVMDVGDRQLIDPWGLRDL